jgi:hypothetical protein
MTDARANTRVVWRQRATYRATKGARGVPVGGPLKNS